MTDEPKSTLTVQSAWQRIMLKAPPGPGRSRHVSLEELQAFIDRARAEGLVMCAGDEERYDRWTKGHNVALMDSQLYVDSPWGEKHD
ncbi:hypothetical protein ACGF5F_29755 [Streptomyces sp. NPDC047821]|uniref:hypothetical protein n=1 Tax=Streptomyces sp. NPDC047821 TaxID=3365488 RepID=UPI003724A9C3